MGEGTETQAPRQAAALSVAVVGAFGLGTFLHVVWIELQSVAQTGVGFFDTPFSAAVVSPIIAAVLGSIIWGPVLVVSLLVLIAARWPFFRLTNRVRTAVGGRRVLATVGNAFLFGLLFFLTTRYHEATRYWTHESGLWSEQTFFPSLILCAIFAAWGVSHV